MSRPTPTLVLYAWHADAVAGIAVKDVAVPCPGWFVAQVEDASAPVPVRIWVRQVTDAETGDLVEPETLQADCLGHALDAAAIWPLCHPVSRAAYRKMVATAANDLGDSRS